MRLLTMAVRNQAKLLIQDFLILLTSAHFPFDRTVFQLRVIRIFSIIYFDMEPNLGWYNNFQKYSKWKIFEYKPVKRFNPNTSQQWYYMYIYKILRTLCQTCSKCFTRAFHNILYIKYFIFNYELHKIKTKFNFCFFLNKIHLFECILSRVFFWIQFFDFCN